MAFRILLLLALLFPAHIPARAQAAPRGTAPVASYTIDASLDVAARRLTARETITYTNRSDTPIPDLVFHLYLNAFRDEHSIFMSEGGSLRPGGNPLAPETAGWIELSALRVQGGPTLAVQPLEDGTLARAELPQAVAPGQSITLEAEFTAQLPLIIARTGWALDAAGQPFFMVGQWFPKLGVWQGQRGWNAYPFHANSEFFADYGDYDVTLHLPADYTVGATGMPVDAPDASGSVRFQASSVIDFAWTASPSTRTESRTISLPGGDIELRYLVLPEHAWSSERVLAAAETAMRYFSQWFGPYPYPRLTIVDVPDAGQNAGGMEYPTLITAGTTSLLGGPALALTSWERSLEIVVIHEAGHQWFMGLLASNEAEEPWLDEGFTDYASVRLAEQVYGSGRSLLNFGALRAGYLDMRRAEYLSKPDVPMLGKAWDFSGLEYGIASYSKPALALLTLERVLGEESMLRVLAAYTSRYRFAHPTTQDFRQVAEEVSGQTLAWFFDGLVSSPATLNYQLVAIDGHTLTAARQGALVIPTEINVQFQDGSSQLLAWDGQETPKTFTFSGKPALVLAEIDPNHKLLVDQVWSDNGLRAQVDVPAWLALFGGLVYGLQDWLLMVGGL
jgi:hypothetical protein